MPSPLRDNPFLRRDSEPARPAEAGSDVPVRPLAKKESSSLGNNPFLKVCDSGGYISHLAHTSVPLSGAPLYMNCKRDLISARSSYFSAGFALVALE